MILKAALKNMIQKKKRTFFQDKFKENSNNSEGLWKTFRNEFKNCESIENLFDR